ncbi:hypothetical protein ACW7BJ_16230 [Azospirillum argentinense]
MNAQAGMALVLVSAAALGGCRSSREVAMQEFAGLTARCGLPTLATTGPNFRERLPEDEAAQRYQCVAEGFAASPALSQNPNADLVRYTVALSEVLTKQVARGLDPAMAELQFAEKEAEMKSAAALRRSVAQAAESAAMDQTLDALRLMQPPQPVGPPPAVQIAPFSCRKNALTGNLNCW